jgi:hypothetical protein
MFLRRNRRLVEGETYEYWTLVKTVRTARGPRQEIVATLGKEPGLESRSRHGWEDVSLTTTILHHPVASRRIVTKTSIAVNRLFLLLTKNRK